MEIKLNLTEEEFNELYLCIRENRNKIDTEVVNMELEGYRESDNSLKQESYQNAYKTMKALRKVYKQLYNHV